jgi:hypothetical protein
VSSWYGGRGGGSSCSANTVDESACALMDVVSPSDSLPLLCGWFL